MVAAILAVVGMVVYGTFVRGINIWKRVSRPANTEDIGVFFKNITYDLRNGIKLTGLRFRGGRREISIPTRVKHNRKEGIEQTIGKTTYSFDRRRKTLYKSSASYSEVYRRKRGRKRTLAENISSLRFEYYVYDVEKDKYSWVTSWQEQDRAFGEEVEENLPLIVKIEVGIPKGKSDQKFAKTVFVPSGCCWPSDEEESK